MARTQRKNGRMRRPGAPSSRSELAAWQSSGWPDPSGHMLTRGLHDANSGVRSALGFVRRWILALLLGPLFGAGVALLALPHIPPVYEASATLLVTPALPSSSIAADELRGAELLARTYAELVKTRPILEEAANEVGISVPFTELQKRVSARLLRDTQLIRISAEDTDPVVAARLANTVADSLVSRTIAVQANRFASSRENLARLVDSLRADLEARTQQSERLNAESPSPDRDAELARLKSEIASLQGTYGNSVRTYEELRITEARGTDTLNLMEPAATPEEPARPRKLLSVALAALAGLIVAILGALSAEYLRDRLRNRQDVGAATGLPTLGMIPRTNDAPDGHSLAARRLTESCRLLLLNLQLETSDCPSRILMVTSSGVGEGKSTIASSLAVVFAESGKSVILVDADLHRPVLHERFSLSNRTGLTTLLLNPLEPAESTLLPTRLPNLRILTAGRSPTDPSALFSSVRFASRLGELTSLCDVLIFDTPPVLAQPEAALIGAHAEVVLLVVDALQTRGRMTRRAIEILHRAGAPLAGAVLNRIPTKAMDYATYGYGYGATGKAPGQTPEAAPQGQSPAAEQIMALIGGRGA